MGSSNYRKRDIRRQCDCCGTEWFMSELRYVGQNRWFCPDDAPGLTAEAISRHNAAVKPLIIRQAKHPRPVAQNATYRLSEAACYRAVMDFAGTAEYVDQNRAVVMDAQYASTMAWAGLYLSDLVRDSNRPQLVAAARVKMLALADSLLAMQFGPPFTTNDSFFYYGAIRDFTGTAYALDAELAGKLFLRAYADTGAPRYLTGADLCATWLRRMQRLDAGAFGNVVIADPLGLPGGFAYALAGVGVTNIPVGTYAQLDMGLSFLADLKAVRGGSYVYGSATLGNQATLDVMIAQAQGFYVDGTFQGTPLISTTPKAYYSAIMSNGTGSGTFVNFPNLDGSEYILSWQFAAGLRSLFDLEGYTARVASLLDYLLSFTGTDYDATFAPAQYLLVKDTAGMATSVVDSTIYDLMAGALLAPPMVASGRSLRNLKDTLDVERKLTADSTDAFGGKNGVGFPYASVYPGPTGQLSFDGTAPMSTVWVESAAVVGGIYRFAPRAIDNQPDLPS